MQQIMVPVWAADSEKGWMSYECELVVPEPLSRVAEAVV